jgi:uncharacterized membrane protein YhiD involved in acid resistance
MKEQLYDIVSGSVGVMTLETLLINFTVAFAIGMLIFVSYRISFSGSVYSARFNVSLVMLTLVTTTVMSVIGNNIALSLGMVGALSIVRFRTAVKDPRDTSYIFWCIAVGVCCGVSDYAIAAVGSAVLFLFLLLFGAAKRNERYLLIIRSSGTGNPQAEQAVAKLFDNKARIRVTNTTKETAEYIFELSETVMNAATKGGTSITDTLYAVENVEAVNIICQNDEINR